MRKAKFRSRIFKLAVLLGLAVTAALASLYIVQINRATALAYEISGIERGISQLTDENKGLTSQYAQNISFQEFDTLASSLNFQKVDKVQYVQILDTTATAKR
ncbi:MAG: hypothetical protein HYV77_00700 [Candidatus Wildermuthbacteria bacterium]|nr:hypothetical protein [Candidatus Wildermuthbacteria bacterium]